jgi:hypothetical protein
MGRMKLYQFGPEVGRPITHFESNFIMTPLVRIAADGPDGTTSEGGAARTAPDAWVARPGVRIGAMHIGPGGVVGFHQATVPQLFVVVAGEGWVRGPEAARTPIHPYQAAFWTAGEWHESGSATGMTALAIEGDGVDPAAFMSEL